MNNAHYHLVVNHLPIIFPLVAVLIMLCGFIFRSAILKRMAYGIFILGALATIAAFATGEGAEHVVEKLPDIQESYIHTHEEKAEIFALLNYILGGLSALGLYFNYKNYNFDKIYAVIVIIFSLVVLYFAKETGTSGGEIRHTEIRTGNIQIMNQPQTEREDD